MRALMHLSVYLCVVKTRRHSFKNGDRVRLRSDALQTVRNKANDNIIVPQQITESTGDGVILSEIFHLLTNHLFIFTHIWIYIFQGLSDL